MHIEKIKEEICTMLAQYSQHDFEHAQCVLAWVLKLKPDADEALQIAALAHDIERAYYKEDKLKREDFSTIADQKNTHARRGAEVMRTILQKYNADEVYIQKVCDLIEHHEVGGKGDRQVLCDADSISYFQHGFTKYLEKKGKERAREKVIFMYERMSELSKVIIKKEYMHALEKIDQRN